MPTLRDTYRQGLTALLADAARLGSTPDDIAARVVVLAELRHAIAAGLGEEADGQPKPNKVRLVWGLSGSVHYLAPVGAGEDRAHYTTAGRHVYRFPCGGEDSDLSVPVDSLAHGLRVITDMARADGYECDDHADAVPDHNTNAPTLPPTLRAEDGWTPWGGGLCPCRDWPEVEYVCRDGYRDTMQPDDLLWEHDGSHGDIIAYRRPR